MNDQNADEEDSSDDESEVDENEDNEVVPISSEKVEQGDDDDDDDENVDEDDQEVDGNKIIKPNGAEGENKIITIDLTSTASHNISSNGKKSTKKRKLGGMLGSIQEMMYGFGDTHVFPPNEKSVTLLQNLVTNYIDDLSWRAAEVAEVRNKDGLGKLDRECFVFIVRKDRAKFQRVYKLLKASEELKTVQKLEIREDQPI